MNKIIQHIPNYCDRFEPRSVEFSTLSELLSIDFVQRFRNLNNFYQFSISNNRLMAEYENGYKWFVVGFLDEQFKELPKWEPKRNLEKETEDLKKHSKVVTEEYLEKEKNRVKTYIERMESSVLGELNRISIQTIDQIFDPNDQVTQAENLRRIKSEISHIENPYPLHKIFHEYCSGSYNAELLLQHCLKILINVT